MMRADPRPVIPRHNTICHRSWANAMRIEPMVEVTMPMKKTLLCPNLSPSRAASSTRLPSTSR